MIDQRFYRLLGPKTATELAAIAGAALAEGCDGNRRVASCAALDEAQADDIAFCLKPSADGTIDTRAGIVIVDAKHAGLVPSNCVAIISQQPRTAFALVATTLIARRIHGAGDPAIHPDARLEAEVTVLPNAVIGAEAAIGKGTVIGAGAIIGPGVQIGRNCQIGAGVVIQCALIGDRVVIGANSVVGEAGFGVAVGSTGPMDVPQLGRVIIQDDVTMGAMVCVDRGAMGDTTIGLGTKIDNLCHVAHNVLIGRGVVMAGFSGVAGSSVIEDYVMMGGRVGVADHLVIGTKAMLAAGAGVIHNVPAGETWGGYPAKPRREWVRELASLKRLSQSASKAKPE